jgi:hypothetical protein
MLPTAVFSESISVRIFLIYGQMAARSSQSLAVMFVEMKLHDSSLSLFEDDPS